MIQYVKRKYLDEDKYNFCIENSIQSKVYAFSWYLDIVADNWDVLVLNDYKAVMPIPWNKKFLLKYSLQPFFCQQLGVYSKEILDNEILMFFLKKIPKNILYTNINLNQTIESVSKLLYKKTNFILDLNQSHNFLFQKYRKDRKKSLKKALKAELIYKNSKDLSSLITNYKKVFTYLKLSDKYYNIIEKVMDASLKNNTGFIREVYYKSEFVCSGFFLIFNNRIYYLFSASSSLGKKHGATTFLINSVIKEYSETNFIFDFEGSNIKSIASFYKSFCSKTENYFNYKTNAIQNFFI